MRRALALAALLATVLGGCSCSVSVDSRPSASLSPTPSAEEQLRAAIVERFGTTEGASREIDNSIDLARAVCLVNKANFRYFARASVRDRAADEVYLRLDDLFRMAVHYLCPQREPELPPLPEEGAGATGA